MVRMDTTRQACKEWDSNDICPSIIQEFENNVKTERLVKHCKVVNWNL